MTEPLTRSPAGSAISNPLPLGLVVIGAMNASPKARLNAAGDKTSAGRRFICPRPACGSKSTTIKSPRSGINRIPHSRPADHWRSPVQAREQLPTMQPAACRAFVQRPRHDRSAGASRGHLREDRARAPGPQAVGRSGCSHNARSWFQSLCIRKYTRRLPPVARAKPGPKRSLPALVPPTWPFDSGAGVRAAGDGRVRDGLAAAASRLRRHLTPMVTRASLPDTLRRLGLKRLEATLSALARPAVRIRTEACADDDVPLGGSKLGGRPDLPDRVEWPRLADRPLTLDRK